MPFLLLNYCHVRRSPRYLYFQPKTNGRTYSRGGAKRKRVIQFSDDEDLEMVTEETHQEKEDEGICMDTG